MKVIKFFSHKHYLGLGKPTPSKYMIPEWYRKAESTWVDSQTGIENSGLKKCMPYMDTMVSGYFLTLPVNVYVNEHKKDSSLAHIFRDEENDLSIRWDGPPAFSNFIAERPEALGKTMPRPAGHYPNHLVFSGSWSIKTPRGWSTLMTPPLNRYDLPFTSSSGIIDSDKFTSPGNIPFFMRKGFSGMIPEGTPMVHLIPIKRENWAMSTDDESLRDTHIKESFVVREPETAYKKTAWKRKKYD